MSRGEGAFHIERGDNRQCQLTAGNVGALWTLVMIMPLYRSTRFDSRRRPTITWPPTDKSAFIDFLAKDVRNRYGKYAVRLLRAYEELSWTGQSAFSVDHTVVTWAKS